jgi:hypothetical protein
MKTRFGGEATGQETRDTEADRSADHAEAKEPSPESEDDRAGRSDILLAITGRFSIRFID